jgi:predicted dehydrogenase
MNYLKHSGGIFRDMAIHDFDLARWILGEEPVEVFASGSQLFAPELEALGDYDTVMVQLRTASGKQCQINCSRQAVYGYDQRIEAFGAGGMLLNDNQRETSVRRYGAQETEVRGPLLNFFMQRYTDAYRLEMAAFIRAVKQGRCTGEYSRWLCGISTGRRCTIIGGYPAGRTIELTVFYKIYLDELMPLAISPWWDGERFAEYSHST